MIFVVCLLFCQTEEDKKETVSPQANQWYDVGVVKATNMLVTHYYVPLDKNAQSNGPEPVSVRPLTSVYRHGTSKILEKN